MEISVEKHGILEGCADLVGKRIYRKVDSNDSVMANNAENDSAWLQRFEYYLTSTAELESKMSLVNDWRLNASSRELAHRMANEQCLMHSSCIETFPMIYETVVAWNLVEKDSPPQSAIPGIVVGGLDDEQRDKLATSRVYGVGCATGQDSLTYLAFQFI